MKWLYVGLQVWCAVAAAVIFWRAFGVIHSLDWRRVQGSKLPFVMFSAGYILLALSSAGSLLAVLQDKIEMGYVAWLTASALLILFDRRRRRPVEM